MKGSDETIKQMAEQGKFEELKKMIMHGANVADFKDK